MAASCAAAPGGDMRRKKFHVVGTDPTDIFDDLPGLREAQRGGRRRTKSKETFARFPHDRALALYPQIGRAAWAILIELDRALLKSRGRNPIPLPSRNLKAVGISHQSKGRGLRELEAAGVIRVQSRGQGRHPLVLHLWYPPHT
jgi:hypothetical protein